MSQGIQERAQNNSSGANPGANVAANVAANLAKDLGGPLFEPIPNSGKGDREAASAKVKTGTQAIVSLQGVTKSYPNGSQALIDVNFHVRKGSFLFITGPSGSGKSTLLKLLYGAERASSGKVLVDGEDLTRIKGDGLSRLRRRVGVVFQDYKLIPKRTVAENVAFVLWAQGFSKWEIERRLQPALKLVGLQHKADAFPEQLSGGEQQRVSIARAIVSTPPLLLADEPTGNLDADNSLQVIQILRQLHQIGITVLVTTHDEGLIRTLNQPVIQIRNGRLSRI
jgi:cell division transport system ATP-binding protein